MGVCERPHQATGFVRDVELEADLEAVEQLKGEAEAEKAKQRPPAHVQVSSCVVDGAGLLSHYSLRKSGRRSRWSKS